MNRSSIVPVIGGGPAGMSCALWLHNCALRPIVIERETALGGMARRSPYLNEGLLGRPGESARENAAAFERHVRQASIEAWTGAQPIRLQRGRHGHFRLEVALRVTGSSPCETRSLSADAIVIATGTTFRGEDWLDSVKNARALANEGRVHVGAPWAGEPGSDRGSHVAVVGGGDNAFDVSRMLVEKGQRVTIIMRSQQPRAQPFTVARLREHRSSGQARVLASRTVQALAHAGAKVRLSLDDGAHVEADHVLLLLGYHPSTDESWMREVGLEQDSGGYVIVDDNKETSCSGVFAVGDVASPLHPCIATAIGTGAIAAREIARRLAQKDQEKDEEQDEEKDQDNREKTTAAASDSLP
jgi:thioredoxin reductase (NADPH)